MANDSMSAVGEAERELYARRSAYVDEVKRECESKEIPFVHRAVWQEAVEQHQPTPLHVHRECSPEEMAREAYPHAYTYMEGVDLVIVRYMDPMTMLSAASKGLEERWGTRILQTIYIREFIGDSTDYTLRIKNYWKLIPVEEFKGAEAAAEEAAIGMDTAAEPPWTRGWENLTDAEKEQLIADYRTTK